jgi:Zn-finger nucleic acid-binding protein
MRCPQCKGMELQLSALELELSASSCPRCDGTSLPLQHYKYWAKNHFNGQSVCLNTFSNSNTNSCTNKPKACPKCCELMYCYDVHSDLGNHLHACDECELVWLTHDQWGTLKNFYLESAYPPAFDGNPSVFNHGPRGQSIRDLLGRDDYRTAAKFKLWLKRHPLQSDILDFLE